jgi:hypothetical protein
MERFDRLQAQVDSLEARVRSYDVGGPTPSAWKVAAEERLDPALESELQELKRRIGEKPDASPAVAESPATEG